MIGPKTCTVLTIFSFLYSICEKPTEECIRCYFRTNYRQFIISRPVLCNILWRQISRENILLGKRVLSFEQDKVGVTAHCSDNSTYQGDILVGADGAYSAVHQHLYALLKEENRLPKSDNVPLPFGCVCLVGQTQVLNPEKFSSLKQEICDFNLVLGSENMCTVRNANRIERRDHPNSD